MDPAAARLAPLLCRLVDHERLRAGTRGWDLDGMRRLLARPGAPDPIRPALQIGGSKGKGTTAAFVEALLSAAGRRAGVYSSPHLQTLRERIRCDREWIPVVELEPILERLLAVDPRQPPTFFEAMTAAASEWFAARSVDLAVYEVGLGGRLDATTALPADAGVITGIELEHTDVLGDTLAAIAAEKAAIVRPGGLAFTAARGEALSVIAGHAAAVGARLHAFGRDEFGVADLVREGGDYRFTLRLPGGERHAVRLPDARAVEVPALALAAAAVRALLPDVPLALDPAPRPRLPGRFEVFAERDGEVLVLDGAHTEESLDAVARECARRWPGRRPAILFAAARGKRWRSGLSRIAPGADTIVVTGLVGTPGEDPSVVVDWLGSRGVPSEVAGDVTAGLAALRRHPGPRVVVGSFYLVGSVRELITGGATEQR